MTEPFEPLRVAELRLRGFRNLEPLHLVPGPRFNVLSGENGQGKSNVLEGIRYVSALDSFRGANTDDLIQSGDDRAELSILTNTHPLGHRLEVRLARGQARAPSIDGKRPRSTLSWLGVLPSVLFHPGDLALAQGSPEGRRTLLDRILTEMDPHYGATLRDYLKALRSRNRLLKMEPIDRNAVTAFDPLLASLGSEIVASRDRVLSELSEPAHLAFARIAGDDVPLKIRYRPREAGDLLAALQRSLDKDVARGFTAEGPHGDDIELGVKAGSAKQHASQGQQRVLVLALRVAELTVLRERTGRIPVLLLDDVSSELDRIRTARFFELLGELGGQVFLTTTRAELIQVEGNRVDWTVSAGRVVR